MKDAIADETAEPIKPALFVGFGRIDDDYVAVYVDSAAAEARVC